MKNLMQLSIACLILTLLASCERDPPTPGPPTKTEMISRQWKFSSAMVGTIDVSAALQACQRDNIVIFSQLKTGLINEGGLKCNAGDPQERSFDWSFNLSQTELIVSLILFAGGSDTYTIVSLTANALSLSQTVNLSGTPQTVVINFVPN